MNIFRRFSFISRQIGGRTRDKSSTLCLETIVRVDTIAFYRIGRRFGIEPRLVFFSACPSAGNRIFGGTWRSPTRKVVRARFSRNFPANTICLTGSNAHRVYGDFTRPHITSTFLAPSFPHPFRRVASPRNSRLKRRERPVARWLRKRDFTVHHNRLSGRSSVAYWKSLLLFLYGDGGFAHGAAIRLRAMRPRERRVCLTNGQTNKRTNRRIMAGE